MTPILPYQITPNIMTDVTTVKTFKTQTKAVWGNINSCGKVIKNSRLFFNYI